MKTDIKCKDCVISQAHRVGDVLNLDDFKKASIVNLACSHVKGFDMTLPPPVNAYKFYEEVGTYIGRTDIYKDIKKDSKKRAQKFETICKEYIKSAENQLLAAAKIAVAGNVIDLASYVQYDLQEEIEKVLKTHFAIDDFIELEASLKRSSNIVYIADNVGEEVFDKLYMQIIKDTIPDSTIYYFTRGKPIINDITYEEAVESAINDVACIVDTGVPTPGFVTEFANKTAIDIFEKSDIVISKGMGNYECLSETIKSNIFYLFKVKCDVVGSHVGAELGSLICKKA